MPEVFGFCGWRFDPAVVGSLDCVVTPPYDVITPDDRRHLASQNPHSLVHLILPEERDGLNRYEAAADTLHSWMRQGVLKQDAERSFYLLEQSFTDPEGVALVRRGFLGVVRLPETGGRTILGHEQTFPKTVEDRFLLTQATQANLGPVFALYADPDGVLTAFLNQTSGRAPDLEARTFEGVTQRVWRVPHDDRVTAFMRDRQFYIADGHHRYGTACRYRDLMHERECPDGERLYDFALMGFVSLSDPGLRVYPTHRLIPMPREYDRARFFRRLAKWFEVERVESDLEARVESEPGCAIGMVIHGDGAHLLRLLDVDRVALLGSDRSASWRDLDVAILHRGVTERCLGLPAETSFTYEREAAKAIAAAERGDSGMAFILKATRADQIQACAEAGEAMPHKSTYFFPKLPSGAAIYRLV